MSSFYGDIKVNSQISLVFDKTYPNRKAMEDAIKKNNLDGSSTGNINGDGVYNTRYVFINYGDRRYSPYHLAEIQSSWYTKEGDIKTFKPTGERPDLYTYKIGTDNLQVNDSSKKDLKIRPYGEYVRLEDPAKYEENIRYYIPTDNIYKVNKILSPDGIDENCEYAINREIDENEYQGSYDHTVWQKIWCSVGTNSTITEKYIMVASLDAKAPKFEVIIDAPVNDDEYERINYTQSDGSRIPIIPLGIYYTLNTKTNEYEQLDLNCIKQWNQGEKIEELGFPINSDKNIYQGASFQYKEILSDIVEYVPLQDKNGNQIITGKEMLDIYLNSIGNIYKKIERNNTVYYTPVPIGSEFEEKDSDNSVVRYCHKTVKEAGYISQDLFTRLFNASQPLYYYDTKNNTVAQVSSIESYKSDIKYYKKVSLNRTQGPHIDPLRSTDLNYKLHIPRNWKFNPTPDFKYNKKGFSPAEQYEEDGENSIHLQKTTSNSLYPVHMDEFGRKLYTKNAESRTIQGEIAAEVNIPEAGYYINNELQYAEQLDQQTFFIDLPELGNMASQIWDIVYPRGKFVKYPTTGSISYSDPEYAAGRLYYKENETKERYTLIGKNEALDSKQTYYIFVRENEDGTPIKTRYMFIGNDRDPESIAEYPEAYPDGYPRTFGEVIRYIYRLLGLDSDNDYLDNFPEGTIWGMWNGLKDLLGTYKDVYDTDNFIPIKSHPSTVSSYPSRPVFSYGNMRDLVFGSLSSDWFKELNNAAFGPLYTAVPTKNYIIQIQADTTVSPNSKYEYYIYDSNTKTYINKGTLKQFESGQTYYYRVIRGCSGWTQVDKSKGVQSKLQYYTKISDEIYEKVLNTLKSFNSDVEYYIPQIIYEQATDYQADTQYYRNMNSLWALLNEFQKCRDGYQSDWIKDMPGSPAYIQHRPTVIYSTAEKEEISYNDAGTDSYGEDNFILEGSIKNTEQLQAKLATLKINQQLMVYYVDEVTNTPHYFAVSEGDEYIAGAKYYYINKNEYQLNNHNIDGLWKSILINASDKEDYIDDTTSETISIQYYSASDIKSIFN